MTLVTFVADDGKRWTEAFGDFKGRIQGRLRLPAGAYRVNARQHPCAGTCAEAFDEPSEGRGLDPPYSTCHAALDIDPVKALGLFVSNRKATRRCSMSVRTLQVPEIIGMDLREAVDVVKKEGFIVRLDGDLSRFERLYGTGRATHPSVEVRGYEVKQVTVTITRVRCPGNRQVC